MAHVKHLSREPTMLGNFRTRNPPRTESRRRCMGGRRRDDLYVNGGWIFKSGVSVLMTLVNLSPEPRMLGTWRTRHPLRKDIRRRCIYFHSRTHFQEESRGRHPGREGFAHPIHNLLCSAMAGRARGTTKPTSQVSKYTHCLRRIRSGTNLEVKVPAELTDRPVRNLGRGERWIRVVFFGAAHRMQLHPLLLHFGRCVARTASQGEASISPVVRHYGTGLQLPL